VNVAAIINGPSTPTPCAPNMRKALRLLQRGTISHVANANGLVTHTSAIGYDTRAGDQTLHIHNAAFCGAAGFDDLLGYPRDERAPLAMRACAAEAEFLIQPMKPRLDGASAHAGIALAVDDVIVWVGIALDVQLPQSIAQKADWLDGEDHA
jgi:hypothetical protein